MTSTLTIAIAGNPNCGKSALFNAFTGIRQRTGNWPGVTVDRKEGHFALDDRLVTVIDLPGIYSLDASSLDERITRDYLLARDFDLIINVVDAANLERNLYLTVQLLEMGVPVVLALNMMDVARRHGLRIDPDRLAQELGCPVVPVVAVTGEGKSALMAATMDVASGQSPGGYSLNWWRRRRGRVPPACATRPPPTAAGWRSNNSKATPITARKVPTGRTASHNGAPASRSAVAKTWISISPIRASAMPTPWQ